MQQMGVSANVAFNTDPTTSMQQMGEYGVQHSS